MTAIGINNEVGDKNALFVVGNGEFSETYPNSGFIDFDETHKKGKSSNAFKVNKDGSVYISEDAHISGSAHISGNAHISKDLYVNGENVINKINNIASNGGNGTVTSITAGEGLDGGIITSSGTISLSQATKESLENADSAKADIEKLPNNYVQLIGNMPIYISVGSQTPTQGVNGAVVIHF
jgi:hypothetical protein